MKTMTIALTVSLLASTGHSQSENRGPECMPGFNATLAKVRAIQRAHSCSLTGRLSECSIHMGLGAAAMAIAGTAAAHGAGLGSKIANAIRDEKFRPCPVKLGQHRYPLFEISSAFAQNCTPQIELDRARIQNAIQDVGQDLAERKKQALAALKMMEGIDTELSTLSGAAREAKLKEVIEASTKNLLQATRDAKQAADLAHTNMGWNSHASAMHKAEDDLAAATRELGGKFQRYFGYKMGDELYDLREMSKRLSSQQQTEIETLLRKIRTSTETKFKESRELDRIERDPTVKRLTERLSAVDSEHRAIRELARNPENYSKTIHANASQLRSSMADLVKAETALADFKSATAAAKNSEDLYAIASRLHNFIPKESLLDPAKSALAASFRELASIGDRLASARERMTNVASELLMKWPRLAELAPGMRRVGTLAAKGVAFAGGAFVTTLTFASNEFDDSCSDMTKSAIFPRDPNKGCSQDLSPGNPTVQKIFEMNPSEMCELMKANPDVKSMVDGNYSNAYPAARARCGTPLNVSIDGFGQIRYNGKTAEILEAGDTTAAVVQFDENGIERGLKFPKKIRGGGFEQLEWNQHPSSGSDRFEKFSRNYVTRILPALAEAQACCNPAGVSPSDAECARLGISSTHRRNEPSSASPTRQ